MANKLNPFEEQLKQAANNFDAPYDASAWSRLESELDSTGASGSSSITKWFVAAVTVVTVGISGYYFTQSSSTESIEPLVEEVTKAIEEPTTQPVKITEENSEQPSSPEENKVPVTGPVNVQDEKRVNNNQSQKSTEAQVVAPAEKEMVVDNHVIPVAEEEKQNKQPVKVESPIVKLEEVVIVTDKTVVCAGLEIEFNLANPTNNTVVWSVNNGVSVPAKSFVFTFMNEGDYIVSATDIETGVVSNELEIKVNPKPDASFTVRETTEQGGVPVVHFQANTTGENLYTWSLGDSYSGTGEVISHTYSKAKDYQVSLQVLNNFGCSRISEERYTNNKEFNLFAPTSFSPNGDGLNDNWFPKALASGYYKFELAIYNSHNRLVYITRDPQESWNGMINGAMVKSNEFYIWKATVTDPDGIQQQYSGSILILF